MLDAAIADLRTSMYAKWAACNPEPETPIYHYTTTAGLVGILEAQKFWATNIRFLNDPLELDHAKNIINEVLSDKRAGALSAIQADVLDRVSVVSELYDSFMDVFIVCFSANKQAKTVWASYNRAEGIAIGIDAPALADRWRNVRGRILFRVLYEHDEQKALVSEVLNEALEFVAQHETEIGANLDFRAERIASEVRSILAEISICLKHQHFRDEQEWRAVYVSIRYEISDSPFHPIQPVLPNGVDFKQVEFRSGLGTVIPYVSVDLFPREGAKGKIPITEFIYGWKLEPSLTLRALEVIKQRYGYASARISRSEVQLR